MTNLVALGTKTNLPYIFYAFLIGFCGHYRGYEEGLETHVPC